jgi:hypothetical protein
MVIVLRIAAHISAASAVGASINGLVAIQDVLSFAFWFIGFFGNTIAWRGQTYYLHPDGKFEVK